MFRDVITEQADFSAQALRCLIDGPRSAAEISAVLEPVKDVIDAGSFGFSTIDEFVDMDSVMGLAFENLVVNNYRELIPHLHLQGSAIISAAPYRRRGTKGPRGRKGCQIDLLNHRRGRCQDQGHQASRWSSAKAALVYDGHLSPVAKADGYFDAIIPFSKLLGL